MQTIEWILFAKGTLPSVYVCLGLYVLYAYSVYM